MIKKIVIITSLLIVLIIPVALANDGGSRPDTKRVTIEYTIISQEVNIGEVFEFSVKIKNHTSIQVSIENFLQIFTESYETMSINNDTETIFIEPYQTVIADISYVVPVSINWYEINGSYYVDFQPIIQYWAKEFINGEEREEWYDPKDDYRIYYQESRWAIPIKIANVHDGSEYAAISVVDDKSIIGFNDSAYKTDASWQGELAAEIYTLLKIENTCEKELEEIYVYEKGYDGDYLQKGRLKADEENEFSHETVYYMLGKDIPKSISIDYRMLFVMDNNYYCTYSTREYKTQIFVKPDVSVLRMETYDKDTGEYFYTYLIENISGKDIENLTVYYGDYPQTLNELQGKMLNGTLERGGRWLIPVNTSKGYLFDIRIGYVVEEVFYYNSIESNFYYSIEDNNLSTGYYGYNDDIWNLYDYYHSGENDSNQAAPEPMATEISTVVADITPEPTVAPTNTPKQYVEEHSTITKKNSYFISPYVYIALVLSAMAVAVVFIFRWKKRMDSENEEKGSE